ncbi:dicarboxylic amino acid permease [Favolaschia claudopus]|uniref:Dicarboxylic amino acid permease n=1 Tax=Favolaschia claudopus TaxID=2862362 RepID=A0AAW0EB86_9AGAR
MNSDAEKPNGAMNAGSEKNQTEEVREGSFDAESQAGSRLKADGEVGETKLVRQLKNRHIAMISITYSVMISLGEMIAYLPIPGGHIKLAERFVDPAFSFTMGWNYWYNWTVVLPAELSAAAVLINYWNRSVNNAVWITIIGLVVIGINMCGAGVYGEAEFIFASIKVVTITGLIILGIVLDLGGGPDHDRIGFRYWKNPGPFVQFNDIAGAKGRFLGWWEVMTQAAFSYIGTEIVAIAAGEAKNPRRNLPKAIKRVYIRILLFYIGGVIIIGLLVPSNDEHLNLASGTAASSPFVIAIQRSGIKALPSLINACLLTSAWSAGSSDLYTSSRALYGLATAGNAPKIFMKTLPNGLPIVSLVFCSAFVCLAYMGVTSGSNKVFVWFSNMTSIAGLMTWFGICVTYLRFHAGMKAQGYERKHLPFASPLQPYAAWYAACACIIICFFSGWAVFLKNKWDTATFVTNYLPFILFPILYAGAKYHYWRRSGEFYWKRPEDLDFVTNIAEIEAEPDDPPPNTRIEKFWAWLM